MLLSTCCDAPILGDEVDPICSACKEHCDCYDDAEETFDPNDCGL